MQRNIKEEELEEIIKTCDFEPKRFHLLITINKFEYPGSFELVEEEQSDDMDDWQYVINVGDGVDYKPGDKVLLDLRKLIVNIPSEEDRTKTEARLEIFPIKVGDNFFTLIPDSAVMGRKVSYPEIEMKA